VNSLPDDATLPPGFHQLLTPPEPDPPFLDAQELQSTWGGQWGPSDEIGRLRAVLVRKPDDELRAIHTDAYQPAVDALVDPGRQWYWTGKEAPDLARVSAQHDRLVEVLESQDVTVHRLPPLTPMRTKSVYVRDPLVTVRGGAIIGRLAPRMRRGEEAVMTREVAALGVPILATMVGSATFEGGSFVKLRPGLAAFGTSVRCNEAAAGQLREILARIDWELIVVPLPGFVVHLDIHFAMVDRNRALVNALGLPYTFLDELRSLGIECIWSHPDEPWAQNLLTLEPGRVLASTSAPRTAQILRDHGIEVLTVPYDEIEKNGGGVHCSTMELLRDDAG
jgi:N-dimethylarginine dimethylaminohydrolase